MFGSTEKLKRQVRHLEYDKDNLEEQVRVLQNRIDRFDRVRQVEDEMHEDELEDLRRSHQREMKDARDEAKDMREQYDALQSKMSALKKLVSREEEILAKEVNLDAQAAILDAAEATTATFQKRLDEERGRFKNLAQNKYDLGHSTGYAEGLAEGLKQAHEITQTDRDNMYDVASKALTRKADDSNNNVTVNNTSKSN